MGAYSLSHLSDQTLLTDLAALVARDRVTTAELLAHIAEVEERELYVPAGHASMYLYCVRVLRFSEQAAYRRIEAARKARQFPAIFAAVTEGRLHLTAVLMLGPHLTRESADELIAAASHKTKPELETILAQRFPKPDVPTRVRALSQRSPMFASTQLSPAIVEAPSNDLLTPNPIESSPVESNVLESPQQPMPVRVEPIARTRVAPLSPERYSLQLTMNKSTRDNFCRLQELLSHRIPSGDLAQVFDHAVKVALREEERHKCASTSKPRVAGMGSSANPRYIPADVRRAVWRRDQGQCTFVSETGHQCLERKRVEFDHILEVAHGGRATVDNLRLRCRAHNQYEAERAFGAEFMNAKREQARRAAVERRSRAEKDRAKAEVRFGLAAG